MENFILPCMTIYGIYMYVPNVHNPASARRILRIQLNSEMVVMETIHRYARYINEEEMAVDLKAKGRKSGSTCDLLG